MLLKYGLPLRRCHRRTHSLARSLARSAFRGAHFGLILALCQNNRLLPLPVGNLRVSFAVVLYNSSETLRDSLYPARLLGEAWLEGETKLEEMGKRQYDGAVATFSPSPGGSLRENFCKRRAGEGEGESRLALITFAYPTHHGGTWVHKSRKSVENGQQSLHGQQNGLTKSTNSSLYKHLNRTLAVLSSPSLPPSLAPPPYSLAWHLLPPPSSLLMSSEWEFGAPSLPLHLLFSGDAAAKSMFAQRFIIA